MKNVEVLVVGGNTPAGNTTVMPHVEEMRPHDNSLPLWKGEP
jgi:hypothetical protein